MVNGLLTCGRKESGDCMRTPVKNKNEWQRLYNKLRVFEQSGGTFEFVSMQEDDEADCDSRGKIARTIERSMTDPE